MLMVHRCPHRCLPVPWLACVRPVRTLRYRMFVMSSVLAVIVPIILTIIMDTVSLISPRLWKC